MKIKGPIGMITDPHIHKPDDWKVMKKLFRQFSSKCKERGANNIILAGDIFTDRSSLNLDTHLLPFQNCLDILSDNGIRVFMFPGNHDKTDQRSESSYLSVFKDHHLVNLIGGYDFLEWGNKRIHLIPYFPADIYRDYLKLVDYSVFEENILVSHFAVDGVRNNDGSVVENGISPKELGGFDRVYTGHYHDRSLVSDFIKYFGSMRQNNFGEDTEKGFTFLYPDGEEEFVKSKFPLYLTYDFILDEIDDEKVKRKLLVSKLMLKKGNNVRLRFLGTESQLSSFDFWLLKSEGYKVVKVNADSSKKRKKIKTSWRKKYDKKELKVEFDDFLIAEKITGRQAKFGRKILFKEG